MTAASPLPDPPERPRKSVWSLLLAAVLVVFFLALMVVVTAGQAIPLLAVFFGGFVVIGLQYLIWGWWFERIYRSGRQADD